MRRDVREKRPTAADISEVMRGKGSPSDKREAGFVKRGGRLIPGKRTAQRLQMKFGSRNRQTKRRVVRKRGRSTNR
jgi:hypothetical protein